MCSLSQRLESTPSPPRHLSPIPKRLQKLYRTRSLNLLNPNSSTSTESLSYPFAPKTWSGTPSLRPGCLMALGPRSRSSQVGPKISRCPLGRDAIRACHSSGCLQTKAPARDVKITSRDERGKSMRAPGPGPRHGQSAALNSPSACHSTLAILATELHATPFRAPESIQGAGSQ